MRIYFNDYRISNNLDWFIDEFDTLEGFLVHCEKYLSSQGRNLGDIREDLIHDYNFMTDFWNEKASHFPGGKCPGGRLFVVKGSCYYKSDNDQKSGPWRGFGGQHFKIRVKETGEIVETSDLWHNGEVPVRFRKQMPDTADFID